MRWRDSIRARLMLGATLVLVAFVAGAGLAVQRAHADSVRAADIKQRLVDPTIPVGAAVNLALCRRNYCSKYSESPSNACRL